MIVVTEWVELPHDSNRGPLSDEMAEQARNCLAENRIHAHFFQHVTCYYANGVLTLRGRVPTDRLRDTLARLLSDLEEIDSIDNQVDVISSTGLSRIYAK